MVSEELRRQLPMNAKFQEPLDEVIIVSVAVDPVVMSCLTTFNGFSTAVRICLACGRLLGFGLRQDFATIAMAQTSSKWSSSTTKKGSTIFVTASFSYMLM